MMRVRAFVVLVAAAVLLLVGYPVEPIHGQSMKVVVTSIDLPDDEDVRMLAGLKYGETPWFVEFTSIRRELLSDPGADPAKMSWTLTGRSHRQRPERFKLSLILEDESGKTLVSTDKNGFIKAGDEDYELTLVMKVKAKHLSRAHTIRIRVVFLMS
jgi:hypothetical protein